MTPAAMLLRVLESFGVRAELLAVKAGPAVMRHELALLCGTRISRVHSLRAGPRVHLAATDIRIIALIPGRQAIGVEIPTASASSCACPTSSATGPAAAQR